MWKTRVDIGLPGQHLKVEHQLDVLLRKSVGIAHRGRRQLEIRRQILSGLLNTPLDLANVRQVGIQLHTIASSSVF